MLNVIDISSWQSDLDVTRMADTDGVIVKATGGASYRNPCMKEHMGQAARAGKLVGLYHFARDRGHEGSAQAEADFFAAAAKPYVGKATLWLDWEDGAIVLGPKWAKAWLDRVKAKTGVTPGIYMSKGVCNQYDWSAVAKDYPLWVAQYPNYERTGWQREPWTDSAPFGAWGKPIMFQYASTGRVKGYGGDLDLDLWYRDRAAWLSMCAVGGKLAAAVKAVVSGAAKVTKAETVSRANVAAQIMEHLCTCPEHGYSQPGRYGTSGYCDVKTDVGTIKVKKGDRDCSSACCEAWELALKGTPYDGKIVRTGWTGNMRDMFVGSGLFSWKPTSFDAKRGDVYLDEDAHTAMCVQNDREADLLAEFSIAETGGIDGMPGDQTGRESSIHGYYDAWDGILHYNGKADTVIDQKPSGTTGTLYRMLKDTNVRKSRKLGDNVVGRLKAGQTVRLTMVKRASDGTVWGHVSEGAFKGRVIGVEYKGVKRAVKVGPKTVDQLAHEVIAGDWGNGQTRIDALTKKGYDPVAVQARVNEILGE